MKRAVLRGRGGGPARRTWPGTEASLAPVLRMGHLDVVPAEPGTGAAWTRPPFSGDVADGYVWGRGALDDKGSVLADVGGPPGAEAMARMLRERNVTLESALDEGGLLLTGTVPGVAAEGDAGAVRFLRPVSAQRRGLKTRKTCRNGHPGAPALNCETAEKPRLPALVGMGVHVGASPARRAKVRSSCTCV